MCVCKASSPHPPVSPGAAFVTSLPDLFILRCLTLAQREASWAAGHGSLSFPGVRLDLVPVLCLSRSSFLPFPPGGLAAVTVTLHGVWFMGSPGLRQGQLQSPHQAELQFEWLGIDGVAAWPHCPGQQHIS